MDLQDKRLQCLRMAAELGGNVDAVMAAAQRMFDFVEGAEPAALANSPAANSSPEPIAVAEPQAEVAKAQAGAIAETATIEALVADPIAACGTALVMPESGSLAEAVLSPEAVTAAEAQVEVAAKEAPAEVTAEETPAEAVTAAEAQVEVAAEEAPAEVTGEETPAEAVTKEVHTEIAAEEAHAPATNPAFIVPVPPASLTDLIGEQPASHA